MTEAALYAFLSRCRLGVLASIGETGTPQAALVGIAVTPLLEIVFDTVTTSRKYSNLTARPACSFVFGWSGERTVQYEGEATEPVSCELERYRDVYLSVWPECAVHMAWPSIAYFVVRPKWIRYSDFDETPPFIQEFCFV